MKAKSNRPGVGAHVCQQFVKGVKSGLVHETNASSMGISPDNFKTYFAKAQQH